MLHLLGIRHHGPGSSKAVLKALAADPPDVLLIEAPADAEGLLRFLSPLFSLQSISPQSAVHSEGIRTQPEEQRPVPNTEYLIPPVAALIYNPKDLRQAGYLPFAAFSPEWQAMQFAVERGIPVRFMDLPMTLQFALDEMEKNEQQNEIELFKKMSPEERLFRRDPMAHLAKLAGYSDSERWWEVMFEAVENEAEIFASLREMTAALRNETEEPKRTLQREAYMRQTIRKAKKEGFGNIAVVCGAWHVPALFDLKKYKASHDAALLRGIKKIKTTATWIPWSYDRLTFDSGYGAGVVSPAWYELLFSQKKEAATRWMINVARLFREEDLDASSAHVIEAIRLSETLAALRGLAVPGIGELKEAAVTCICEGSPEKLELIENKLVTGNKVGSVPDIIPSVPLQKDIEKTVKSARLKKYWENTDEQWLGATAAKPQGGIDLRSDAGKMKSHLLHRLNLLDINWGQMVELNRHQSAGGFTEFWKLQWSPEFAVRIIEMAVWGNTVEEACANFLLKKTEETTALPALTQLVKKTLNAHLPAAFDILLKKLEDLAALSSDVYHLMDALPPLVQVLKYGNTRGTDVGTVEKVVGHLVPRICIGLPAAVANLDEDASADAFKNLQQTNRALGMLNDENFNRQWFQTLQSIAADQQVNGILSGACTRILFDKKIMTEEATATRMRYALSPSSAPLEAAQWLEGFLVGSGLLLLHNRSLWNLLDGWVEELNDDSFSDVLALLRRTFSKFSPPERQRMMALAKQGKTEKKKREFADYEEDRAKVVLPVVRALLGI
ncbi:MAG TPA: hypothetical protein ENJ95_17475 [Bacteroidetes bacterium]|nr:hypothetical protein [Bacteroidota bacterium]